MPQITLYPDSTISRSNYTRSLCIGVSRTCLLFGALVGYFLGWGRVQNCFWVYSYRLITFVSEFCSISALPCSFEFLWVVVVVPSDYFVSTQLHLWLFCCWGCGCCWAVTIRSRKHHMYHYIWNLVCSVRWLNG